MSYTSHSSDTQKDIYSPAKKTGCTMARTFEDRKRERVKDIRSLKHGDTIEITTPPTPNSTHAIAVTGVIDGFPWSEDGSGPPDMIRMSSFAPRSGGLKDYSLRNRIVYRLV